MSEINVFRDPDTTPAQERMGELVREFKGVLGNAGYPTTEAAAKVADFRAAVLDVLAEELRADKVIPPVELNGWWRRSKRNGWWKGLDYACDHIFRATMRQEAWARVLRNPKRIKRDSD